MIGLVVVSHSAKTAEETAEVVAQMGGGNARIIPAGGNEDGAGTSSDRTREGTEEADDGGGVVALVDLGSAMMNTELVIKTATDSEAITADAPVLEGTLSATIKTTSKEATLDLVVECAEDVRDYRRLN